MKKEKTLAQLEVAKKELEKAREKRRKALTQSQIFNKKYDDTLGMLLNAKEDHEKSFKIFLKAKKEYKKAFEKLKKAEEKNQKAWPQFDFHSTKKAEAWSEYKQAQNKVKKLSDRLEEL